MTALQNKNTTGAIMQLKLLNQSLTTLSTGAGGVATSGGIPGPVPVPDPSGDSSGSGPSGGHGVGRLQVPAGSSAVRLFKDYHSATCIVVSHLTCFNDIGLSSCCWCVKIYRIVNNDF